MLEIGQAVKVIGPQMFRDERGSLAQSFRAGEDIVEQIVQGNTSINERGVIRGLHYQPYAQGRLVRCAHGAVYDVSIDMREGSPSFGQHIGMVLDAIHCMAVWIPSGFAHGFQALTEDATVIYEFAAPNDPATMLGVRWDDPEIGIKWPLANPIISAKDRSNPLLRDAQRVRL